MHSKVQRDVNSDVLTYYSDKLIKLAQIVTEFIDLLAESIDRLESKFEAIYAFK